MLQHSIWQIFCRSVFHPISPEACDQELRLRPSKEHCNLVVGVRYLSVYLHTHLFAHQLAYRLFFVLYLFLYRLIDLSVCQSVSLSVCLSFSIFRIRLSTFLVRLFIYLAVLVVSFLAIFQFVSICTFFAALHLSICPSTP